MGNEDKNKVDIAVLQERVQTMDKRLEKIETNHLPHIWTKLHKIDRQQAYYSGAIVVVVGLVELIIRIYL